MRCAARGCKHKTVMKAMGGAGVSFFSFPKLNLDRDAKRRQEWIRFCNRDGFEPKQHHRLCSLHFSSVQLQRDPVKLAELGYANARMKLKDDAVPDIRPSVCFLHGNSHSSQAQDSESDCGNADSLQMTTECVRDDSQQPIPQSIISGECVTDDTVHCQSKIVNQDYVVDSAQVNASEFLNMQSETHDSPDEGLIPRPVCLVRNIRSVYTGEEVDSDCEHPIEHTSIIDKVRDAAFVREHAKIHVECEQVKTKIHYQYSEKRNELVNFRGGAKQARLVDIKVESDNEASAVDPAVNEQVYSTSKARSYDESSTRNGKHRFETTGPRRQYHCPMCPATSDSFDILKSHIFAEHPEMGCLSNIRSPKTSNKNPDCGIMSQSQSEGLESLKQSTAVSPSSDNAILDEMLKDKSIYMDGDLFCCTSCTKPFKLLTNLLAHRCRHLPLKKRPDDKVECSVCKKTFTQKYSLKLHMRIHTGEKPFKCQICEKPFRHNHGLALHLRTHTGEKPHGCVICGKSFVDLSNLRAHLRSSHTKEKPFKCEDCGKMFCDKPRLAFHRRIHSDEKPDKCCICDASFRWPSQLKKHMKTAHDDSSDHYKTVSSPVGFQTNW